MIAGFFFGNFGSFLGEKTGPRPKSVSPERHTGLLKLKEAFFDQKF